MKQKTTARARATLSIPRERIEPSPPCPPHRQPPTASSEEADPVRATARAHYSSRFCSLTGIAGFRATEVGWTDRHEFRWRVLIDEATKARTEGKEPSSNAIGAAALFAELEKIGHSDHPHRTLLAPQPGGPMFITAKQLAHPAPSAERKQKENGSVLPMQADLNAACALAFRAVAHPDCAHIHQRLRTERKKGGKNQPDSFLTREPRRFGKDKVAIVLREGDAFPKERNSNLFYDEHLVANFGRARLESDSNSTFPYASGPGLWKRVNDRTEQWQRCKEINDARQRWWHDGKDEIPM